MNGIRTLGFFTLLAFYPHQTLAQNVDEDDLLLSYGDEELLSIATGKTQPIYRAPAVATVITAKQIEAMGATNLDQVLESVPGLHVSISSNRGSPIYSIRGIHTDKNPQILVLINGIPMTQLLLGDRGVGRTTLSVNHIARVEIIRGPGSAIYGADAFSGVINVITKNAAQINGTEAGTRIGSYNHKEFWFTYGEKFQNWDVSFGIESAKSNGDPGRIIASDAQSVLDAAPFTETPVSLAPGQLNTGYKRQDIRLEVSNDQWSFKLWNWHQDDEVGPGLASALDPNGNYKINNFMFDTNYKGNNLSKTWEYEIHIGYMDTNTRTEQTLLPPGTTLPIGPDGNLASPNSTATLVRFTDGLIGNPYIFEKHHKLDFTSYYSGLEKHLFRLAAGASYAKIHAEEYKNFGPGVLDNLTPSTTSPYPEVDGTLTDVTDTDSVYIKDTHRTIKYLSIQDEWSVTRGWTLTMGIRYDDYSNISSTTNPRIALVWDTKQNLTTKLLYGKAFRAPALAELFAINNPVVLGNPNLDPETIDTYEVAFDYRPNFDIRMGLNIFYYKLKDLIEFVQDPGLSSQTVQNVGTQSGHGFEFEFDWSLQDNLTLSGHYAFQKSKDERNNVDSGNTPEQQIYLNLNWKLSPSWHANTQAYWIGKRNREFGDIRTDINDYSIVNMTIGCDCIIPELDLSFTIKNIFDQEAREPSPVEASSSIPGDYPLEGRSIYFRANYTF